MACCLNGAKPLSEPMLAYYQLQPLGTNLNEIWITIQQYSFKKMELIMSSVKWSFCLHLHVLCPMSLPPPRGPLSDALHLPHDCRRYISQSLSRYISQSVSLPGPGPAATATTYQYIQQAGRQAGAPQPTGGPHTTARGLSHQTHSSHQTQTHSKLMSCLTSYL